MKIEWHSGRRARICRRTLPVDLQQHVFAGVQQRLDLRSRSAVEIVEYLRVFQELMRLDHALKLGLVDKEVIAAVLLGGALTSCGVGDRKAQRRLALHQRPHQRRLARTRRCGNHEQLTSACLHPDLL